MGKHKVNLIQLRPDEIYVREESGNVKNITEHTGIHAMVLAAMPNIQRAYESNRTPYDIFVEKDMLFALNKVCFDKYEWNAIPVYLSDVPDAKPMARFKDVRFAPKNLTKKKDLADKINQEADKQTKQ